MDALVGSGLVLKSWTPKPSHGGQRHSGRNSNTHDMNRLYLKKVRWDAVALGDIDEGLALTRSFVRIDRVATDLNFPEQ